MVASGSRFALARFAGLLSPSKVSPRFPKEVCMAQDFVTLTASNSPAVFSRNQSPILSRRYTHIHTDEIIQSLERLGWRTFGHVVAKRNEAGLASGRSADTAKHLVTLRQHDSGFPTKVGQDVPQIVIRNSHDGSKPLGVYAGLFVLVCTNGLIRQKEGFSFSLKHIRLTMDDVIRAVDSIVANFGRLLDDRDRYDSIRLTESQQVEFAQRAIALRFAPTVQVSPTSVLDPLRGQVEPTLWNTFNTVQRHLTKGGIVTTDPTRPKTKVRKSRSVSAIDETVSLQTGLWELLDEFGNALAA